MDLTSRERCTKRAPSRFKVLTFGVGFFVMVQQLQGLCQSLLGVVYIATIANRAGLVCEVS